MVVHSILSDSLRYYKVVFLRGGIIDYDSILPLRGGFSSTIALLYYILIQNLKQRGYGYIIELVQIVTIDNINLFATCCEFTCCRVGIFLRQEYYLPVLQ